ncbi:MAG: hypothetical protein A3E81_03495 [Gammaproteobacteria bacterium RIFCSPHIGHO2_12_FULL_36_30]|nr:MAG: hypothetical protein A3E81_03495 [Gammaproteobacteria bacterium RIFCSPHIGHO2_12_FULL_36_30]
MSLCFMIFSSFAFAETTMNTQSVAGYWQTINKKTKKPSSIIHIKQNGEFYEGRIIKTFPSPGESKTKICVGCTGAQKGKPILGLTIIKNMVCQSRACEHGTILDPRDGKLYHATMHLINQGMALKVRGYVGIPLFGKTVVWQRVSH